MSITIPDKKRDYYVLLDNLLCVGGEDKTSEGDFHVRWHYLRFVSVCSTNFNGRMISQRLQTSHRNVALQPSNLQKAQRQ